MPRQAREHPAIQRPRARALAPVEMLIGNWKTMVDARQALGGEAPTTEQLIAHELSDRASQLIVEDFFETRKKQRRR